MTVSLLGGLAVGIMLSRPTAAQQTAVPAPTAPKRVVTVGPTVPPPRAAGRYQMVVIQASNFDSAVAVVTDTATGQTWFHEIDGRER
jgi:hypothetical protein